MDVAECFRQANDDAREACHIQRLSLVPLKNPIQRLTARAPQVVELTANDLQELDSATPKITVEATGILRTLNA